MQSVWTTHKCLFSMTITNTGRVFMKSKQNLKHIYFDEVTD
jgi:hypothetical protein